MLLCGLRRKETLLEPLFAAAEVRHAALVVFGQAVPGAEAGLAAAAVVAEEVGSSVAEVASISLDLQQLRMSSFVFQTGFQLFLLLLRKFFKGP